ncbi:MAG: hypothetical protein NT099_08525 [Candidatus Saganbacteria bacterium]|nr:hypothetical protein [Candidatus Saganbacteria bacterium]
MITWIWTTFKSVILTPEAFFKQLGEEDWKGVPLTFLIWVSWIVAFGATLMAFVNKYWPVGITLVQEINFLQILLVLPVILAVIFVFFGMTFVILGGFFVTVFYFLLLFVAFFFQYITQKPWQKLFPGVMYSGSVLLFSLVIFLFAILVGMTHLPTVLFQIVFNIVYIASCFYFWKVWAAVLCEKGGLELKRGKLMAFWTVLPFLLVGIIVGTKLFDKISSMLI